MNRDGLKEWISDDEVLQSSFLIASLDVISIAELATVLIGAEKTGALEIYDDEGSRTLFFEDGGYTGAQSSHEDDRLGTVMWRAGKLSLDQLVIATEMQEPGTRLGRVLVELGYLAPNQLREQLLLQARSIFRAACLEDKGVARFVADKKHRNPFRFGTQTEAMVDEVLDEVDEYMLLRLALNIDQPCQPVSTPPQRSMEESETAIWQLIMSAHNSLTYREVLKKSGLGKLDGLRTLARLSEGGYFDQMEMILEDTEEERESKIPEYCESLNEISRALAEIGVTHGLSFHDLIQDPPEEFRAALSSVQSDEPMDAKLLESHADGLENGPFEMECALMALLDAAMFEARDLLDDEKADELQNKIEERDLT